MNDINFAAIDIGSNAVRLLIKSIDHNPESGTDYLTQEFLVRFPLRLGGDAFSEGEISKKNAKKLICLMKAFKQMLKIYNVADLRACTTSAMRDAKNSEGIVKRIYKKTKIKVEIIDGEEEARIVYDTHIERFLEQDKNYLYVDVGGGSTQVTLIHAGELAYSHSFNIGTVRMIKNRVKKEEKEAFTEKLTELSSIYPGLQLIGSGGNINKLYKMSGDKQQKGALSIRYLQSINKKLSPLSVEQRMKQFNLRRDRAEVIVYASDIFLEAAALTHSSKIIVPTIGIADGIIEKIYENYKAKRLS